MGRSRTLSAAFCALAFLVVFAHSVVPHEHHCDEAVEQHIHHFQHCEELGTFIVKYDGSASSQSSPILQQALPACASSDALSVPEAGKPRPLDSTDHFRIRLRDCLPHGALRGPPTI